MGIKEPEFDQRDQPATQYIVQNFYTKMIKKRIVKKSLESSHTIMEKDIIIDSMSSFSVDDRNVTDPTLKEVVKRKRSVMTGFDE